MFVKAAVLLGLIYNLRGSLWFCEKGFPMGATIYTLQWVPSASEDSRFGLGILSFYI